jgi:hypothetical protein
MNKKQKILEKINDIIYDLSLKVKMDSDLGATIDISEEDFASEIDELVEMCDGKSVSKSIQNKTITEIISTMNLTNYNNFDELIELDDDSYSDADSEPKYIYKYYYFKHVDSKEIIEVCVQTSGDEDLTLMHKMLVEKKEVITYQYVKK